MEQITGRRVRTGPDRNRQEHDIGRGESRHADIGISLPGTGEAPSAPVFIDGEKAMTLRGENIADEFVGVIDAYVARRYARPES